MDWKEGSTPALTPKTALEQLREQMKELRRQQEELSRRTAAFERRYRKVRASLSSAVNRATRAESYLEPFLRSRIYRGVWGLGLASRPGWMEKYEQRREKEQAKAASVKARAEETAVEAAEIARLSRQLDAEMAAIAGGRAGGHGGANGAVAAEAMPETEMDAALLHLVSKGFRPAVILDVGSAKGFWSERTRWLYYPEADYYMIDPLDESQGHLQELASRSGKFHPLQMAIGREKGEMTMNVTPDGDGSSLLSFPSSPTVAHRIVPVERLDDLLADGRIKMPELVKIDVQGFEIEVLAGASQLFGAVDVFIIEVNMFPFVAGCPVAHEVVAYMAERGYRIYDLAGVLRRPFENDLGQMDLVFVRNESRLVGSNRWM